MSNEDKEKTLQDHPDAGGAGHPPLGKEDKQLVIEALKQVEDPELFLDIWFLGLVYSVEIEEGVVSIEMTFTTPACPMGPHIVEDVKQTVGAVPGVSEVKVEVVFSPPWEPSDELKGLMGYM